jgi:hypothetical protein
MDTNIFGVSEGTITSETVKLPAMWGRAAALEVGAKTTTIVWAAFNRTTDTMYVYDVYQAPTTALPVHAAVITQAKAPWIPVLFDTEGAGRVKEDGIKIAYALSELRLEMLVVKTNTEAGISELTTRLHSRRLRVFDCLPEWFAEYRRFARNEKGDIPDDETTAVIRLTAMLATHGAINGVSEAKAAQNSEVDDEGNALRARQAGGRNPITGY